MRQNFPTKDYLETLSIEELRQLDIFEKDEEELVQSVIDSKRAETVSPAEVDTSDINTDLIKTPEDEAQAQAIIDARIAEEKTRRESIANGDVSEISETTPEPLPVTTSQTSEGPLPDPTEPPETPPEPTFSGTATTPPPGYHFNKDGVLKKNMGNYKPE